MTIDDTAPAHEYHRDNRLARTNDPARKDNTMTDIPRIQIGYTDDAIIWQTSGGDVRLTPATAAELAVSLIQALHAMGAHQEFMAKIAKAMRDNDTGQGLS